MAVRWGPNGGPQQRGESSKFPSCPVSSGPLDPQVGLRCVHLTSELSAARPGFRAQIQ